jgi:hypothetical protein
VYDIVTERSILIIAVCNSITEVFTLRRLDKRGGRGDAEAGSSTHRAERNAAK